MTKYLLRWTDHGITKEKGPFETMSEAMLASMQSDEVKISFEVVPVEVSDEIL